jgi:hypothetical protein
VVWRGRTCTCRNRGAPNYVRNLLFRNYLRAHPEVAQEYGALKRRLARRFPHNEGFGYSLGKRAFCAAVLAPAEAEAQGQVPPWGGGPRTDSGVAGRMMRASGALAWIPVSMALDGRPSLTSWRA